MDQALLVDVCLSDRRGFVRRAARLRRPLNRVGQRHSVIIDSPNSMQNNVLAQLIEARTGYPCVIRPAERLNGSASAQQLVPLDAAHCAARLPALCASHNFSITVINADEAFPCEHVAYPGVKGLFCADTTEDNLVKGIRAIFDGEYWLPRRLLFAHLDRTRSMPETPSFDAIRLTPKEVQTLRLLAKG
jgi:hypothetical protein